MYYHYFTVSGVFQAVRCLIITRTVTISFDLGHEDCRMLTQESTETGPQVTCPSVDSVQTTLLLSLSCRNQNIQISEKPEAGRGEVRQEERKSMKHKKQEKITTSAQKLKQGYGSDQPPRNHLSSPGEQQEGGCSKNHRLQAS